MIDGQDKLHVSSGQEMQRGSRTLAAHFGQHGSLDIARFRGANRGRLGLWET